MVNKYRYLFLLLFLYSNTTCDYFTDTFLTRKKTSKVATTPQKKNSKPSSRSLDIQKLLPIVDEKNPDISFIKTRNSKSMSLDESFVELLESTFQVRRFIETGTYLGDTTETVGQYFLDVDSIELSTELYEKAKKRFSRSPHIHLHLGDSTLILPTLLQSFDHDDMIIFLDAHFSMGNTARGSSNTPIMDELEILKQKNVTDAILIIDDIRMFYKPLKDLPQTSFAQGYPTLQDIVAKVISLNPEYQCIILYDVLLAFPAQRKITVSPLVRAATISRLFDGQNCAIKQVIEEEWILANASKPEKETINELSEHWIEPWSQEIGFSSHYALWQGLTLLAEEKYSKALAFFKDAKKRGLTHWRIDWYIAMAESECFFIIKK